MLTAPPALAHLARGAHQDDESDQAETSGAGEDGVEVGPDEVGAGLAHLRRFNLATSTADAELDQLHHHAHTRLGPDHPSTLTTRHNLADWRGRAGDPAGAADDDR